MTLQQQQQKQTISCGTKYLKETIGLSLTNNYLYQFLYMKNTIKIIKYEYKKLIKNNYHNEYRLNLIDGEVLINGLNDLIPDKIVKNLLKVIQWTGEDVESNVNNSQQQHIYNNDELRQQPIISIAMSMKKNGKIRIYCLKSFDQLKYYVGDYNQEIDQTIMETFYASHKKQHIMGIISNKHFEIISFFYDKSSYRLKVFKLLPNQYGITEFKWKKSLIIDASMISIYQLEKQPNEKEKRLFYRSFSKIFGQFTFTFGFIDQKRIFLFANQDEKLLSIPYNVIGDNNNNLDDNNIINNNNRFELQIYQNFFHCNDQKHNDDNNNHTDDDDDFVVKKLTTITVLSSTPSGGDKNPNNKNNNKSIKNPTSIQKIILIIMIIIFGPLLIILLIVCCRNCRYYYLQRKLAKKIALQKSDRSFPLGHYHSNFIKQHKSIINSNNHNNKKNKRHQIHDLNDTTTSRVNLYEKPLPYSSTTMTISSDSLNKF